LTARAFSTPTGKVDGQVRKPLAWVVNSSSFGRIFPEHMERLRGMCEVKRVDGAGRISGIELGRMCRGASVVVASVSPRYDSDFFARTMGLKLVSRHGIGFNNIDLDAATHNGVIVTKVSGVVEREAMAESAVMLMLAAARRTLPADRAVRAGRWAERPRFVGCEIGGKTVGVIGCGNIGSRVVEILRKGFGARVLATDPNVPASRIRRFGALPCPLSRLLRESDFITLHASLTASSRGIVGRRALGLMKPGAILVNNARGELLDEKAVVRALRSGRLAGLGVDVVACEPAGKSHAFLRCPNTVVVPHIGAYTVESLREMGVKVLNDVEDVLSGRRPREVVNPAVFIRGKRRGK